jgi:hypothetical protein
MEEFYVPIFITTMLLLLRRTLVRSYRLSSPAESFTIIELL